MDFSLKRLARNTSLLVGGVLVALMTFLALAAPWVTSVSPTDINPWNRLDGSSRTHLLGTDGLGRDIYSRVIYGARASLLVAYVSVAIALVSGVFLGCLSGYYGGRLDNLLMRFIDVIFAFPVILLALVIITVVGSDIAGVVTAIAIVYTAPFARVARGATLSIKNEEFITAARCIGAASYRILFRHILPNMLGTILVLYTVRLGEAILIEASLSFLGLGVQPPTPAWGSMLSDGKSFMEQSPWVVIGPGLAIVLSIIGFSLFGDGLRDVLDPTMSP